ncbi:non-specific lipid-transfer protein 1-like [Populus alba x Populus x berolinensis]|nr:non-specific lipid-transfer protein 1-like [Populus alba x Populus x berolinensis]
MANAKLICALLLCMVVTAPMFNIVASIPCHTVKADLANCLPYFKNGGRVPPAGCCRGVQNVNNAARTTKDRRDTCSCLKTTAKEYRISNFKFAAALPRICKVKIPYHISASIDCSRIK